MFSIIKKYKRNLNNICKIREKGVSLISLIVIIIVLLILAGVTIKISSGDSGLIKKTKKGVAMYQNASVNESETLNEYARKLKTFVEVPKAETIEFKADITGWTTKDVTITATSDDPDYEIEIKSEDSDWSVRKDNKITVSKNQQINARLKNLVDKYSEDVATYNVTNIDKDAPDKTAPALKATTNSITVTFKQKDDGSGIAKREYSIDNGATWKAGDSVFTFSGLTQGKKYEIITRATDRVENQSISDVSYITTETIPAPVVGSNLTFTPSTSSWTNSNVSVAVSTTVKGYTLQTSTDGKTWGTTNPLTYSANGTAYARLWDGNNASAVATTNITNIDKLAPTNTAPTVATTTNKITITNKQVDQDAANGSGKSDLNASKTQYRLVTDTNGTTAVTGKDWQSSNVFSGLTQNTAYYVQTKVTDNAGNTITSAVATAKTTSIPTPTTGANVIFTPTPSGWTNGNVSVKVSTTVTGYTLQTSTDGKAWSTTNPLTYSANGTAYARLWDGNNASAVATTNITNIDKLAPTNTTPTVATTTNRITITNKQVDQNAANGSGKSDLNASKTQYRLVTDTNGTTAVTGKDWQSSNVFSGLTQNTTYYVQTKVTDNAGNTTTSAVATAKTGTIPTPTTGSNLTFTPSTSSWTNGNVNVTVSTTITGFTLQTSTDGKAWSTTNPLTYSANGTAYARLWDGNNASAVATTNITNIDKLAPTNTAPTVATTTNKITITNKQVDQNAGNGSGKSDLNASKTQYRLVTDTNGTTAVTGKDWQSSNVFSGLTQNTTYYVQTKVTDNAGNTTTSAVATAKTTSIPTPTTGSNLIFTPSTSSWTNGNVSVNVATTITGYTLQTSTDGKTWGTTNPLTYSVNGTAYARLWDGNNASAVATTNITNIDKLAPTNTAPTVATTTNKITITNKQVDQNAGSGSGKSDLNASKTQYRLVTDTNGTTAVTGKDWQSSNVFSGLTQNTTYYVQTKVTDNAGNTTTSAVATAKTTSIPTPTAGSNLTFTPTPSGWTNGNVSVKVTTTVTGYTLQTSTDGKSWSTTNPLTYSANGTAYARLWDGNNASAVATTNITNIDKLAPTNTAPTVATTTNKITATLKQVDQNAANGSGKSDLNASKTQYRLVTDTNGTTAVTGKDWQSSNVFSGLTQNTTYYVQTKVTDNAGNTTTSAVATAKTTSIPTPTTGSNLTFTPSTSSWTNGNVNVTVSTTITGFTLQTSTDGKTWGTTNPLIYSANGTAYARLWDGNNASAVATTNITNIDKLAPTNTAPTVAATTNKITITNKQVDQNAANGSGKSDLNASKTQYRLVTDTNGTTAVTGKDWQSSNVFSGLTQNTTYYVQTKVTDNAGNSTTSAVATAKTTSIPTPTTGSNLTFTPSTSSWTNGNVNVTVSTTITGFTLQTSTDGKTWGTTNPLIYSANGTAYARLWDGNNASAVATTNITNIDKLAPTNTAPTVETTTNKITITNKQVDQNAANGSGKSDLNASKTQYRLVTDTNGTTAVTGKDWQSSNVFSGLTQNTTYYVQTKVTDNAGNTTTSAVATAKTGTIPTPTTGSNLTFTPSTSSWTNGNVSVNVATTITGYTLQTSTDGKTWGTTNPLIYSANGTAYARLWDGNNASAVATTNITNIDKLAPTNTAPTVATTTNKITATLKQVDQNAANGSGKSDLNASKTQYRLVTDTNGTTAVTGKDWQSSNVFSGLTQNTTYYVQTKVTDNAGNTTTSAVATAKTAIVPSGTTSGVITLTPDHNTWTNTDVKVTATTNQTGYTIQMSTDGKTFTDGTSKTLTSNGTVYARLRDSSNNYGASATISISIIDKVAPTKPTYKAFYDDGKTTYTSGTWTNKHVKTDISSIDANSGINRIEYSFDKNSWNKFQFGLSSGLHQNGTTYTGTESWGLDNRNDTVYFRAIDNAGNISEVFDSFNIRYDVTAPTTTAPTATTKTNSITVTNKQTDALSGIASIQYQIKKNSDSAWGTLQSGATFNGLTQNTKYDVRTHAVDKAGNASDSAVTTVTTGTIPGLTTGSNLTFTPSTSSWTNGNVNVTVSTTITGFTLQTSTDGKAWSTTNPLTYSANGTAYARLWDGNNASAVATTNITNIDKLAPTNTAPTVATTTNKITVTLKQVDQNAGSGSGKSDLNASKTQYRLVTDTNGTTAVTGKDWQSSNVFSGLTQNTTYYVQTKVTDNAGNTTTSAVATAKTTSIPTPTAGSNLTFTPTPSGWTNGNVSVKVTTTVTGYTLQTSTDGKSWGTTNPLTYTANGTAYARLWDGNNASAVATTNITNIDKLAPTNTAPTVAATTNKITITNKQVDQNAANGSGKSDLNASKTQYRLVTNTSGTTAVTGKDWQSSNVFSGLTQNTTYYVQTKVTDNAGNTTTSAVATAKTGTIPTPTTGSNLTFTPSTSSWTNGNVSVAVRTTVKGYTLQTSTDGKTWSTTNPLIYSANGTAYARLWDGNNASAVATTNITNIDKLAPTNTAPTVATTTNKITATLKQVDQNAGSGSGKSDLNASKTQYRLVTNTSGTTAVTGKDWQSSNVFSGLTQNTTYYVQTKVTDNAGNTTTSAVTTAKTTSIPTPTTGSNLTFTPSTSSWTNGNVSVAVSTTVKGYTLQTSTDGKTWSTTNPLIYSANGTAYARLWDGNNASAVATTNITNIDKTAPSFNASISNVSSSGYDVIITGVSDTQSGVNRIQCPTWTESNGQDDIDGAWVSSTKSRATKQSDGSYKYRVNITDHKNENGKYITHVYGYDNVGNNMHLVLNTTVPAVTITWNANGGTAVNATSGKAGNAIGTLPTTTRTGYTFAGWFTAASGGTQITTTSTYPTSGNVTYYAHWNVNQYSVTCEDWFVDSSNNRKVKLGSASKKANYGTTVNGSEWGTDASMGKYYSSYVYKSSTSATVGTSGATVYRYFWAWTDLNVFYASGSTQGGATVSLKVGNGSWVDVTNESNTTQPYGTTYYIKNIRPKNSYEEFGRVENLTWDSTNSYYSYTPTKAGTSMNIYMKYKVYYYDVNPNAGIASFDITYGGTTETKLTDFYRQLNYGTQVVIKNVVAKPGYTYTEYSLSGTLSKDNASTNQNIITTLGAGNGAIALTGVDKTAPTTTAPTATTKTNSITVTNKQTDNGSGIASIQYQIKKNGTSTWGSLQSGATFNGLTQNTKYDVRTHAVDKAGNASDSAVTTVTTGTIPTPVRDSNVTFTATPSGWTHGNVSVKVATTVTGYTLQTSTNGRTWGTANPLTYSANGTAYARLWDGNNASAVATTSITNIDKTAPTISISGEAGNTSVKINATTSDSQSGVNSSSLKYKIDNGTWQTSNVFDNLDPDKTYTFVAQVTDNAENTKESNKISVKPLGGVFAKLYDTDSDGTGDTLTFGNKSNFAYNGTLKKDYGNIKEEHQWVMPWLDSSKNITKVEFVTEVNPHYTAHWFYYFEKLNTIKSIKNLNTSNVTDMDSMFCHCSSLTSLDVSNFNTSNVTNMSWMFDGCSSLTSLNVSNFNTSKVTDMSYMFSLCRGLTSLNVSNFNTSNVTDMSSMFSDCTGLKSLDVSNFNTSNVTDMENMFDSCSSLTSLNVSNFNTSKVTNMNCMFMICRKLTSLDVRNFNTSNVTDMSSMFANCVGLTSLNVSSFDTSNVTNMSSMFYYCKSLTSLDVSNFNTSNVTNMSSMFSCCQSLTSLDLSNFNTSKVTNISSMFEGPGFFIDTKLTTIYVDSNKWSTKNVTNSDGMFNNCTKLKGQRGTVYSSSHVDASYAKVDGGTSNPGYLTQK